MNDGKAKWRRLAGWRALTLALSLVPVLHISPAATVSAGELSLLINGKAIHMNVPPDQTLNENNWGGGLQYDFPRHVSGWLPFLTASGFKDSLKNPSYYAGGGFLRRLYRSGGRENFYLDAGLVGFLMVREDYKDMRPFPGILPVVSIGADRLALNITYIPDVRPKMVPLWFFQLKLNLSPGDHH